MSQPWDGWSDEQLWSHLRANEQGVNHGSRVWLRLCLRMWGTRSMLDVGCGTGVEYEGIKREGLQIEYTGLDASARAIRLAQAAFAEAQWHAGDAEHLPFRDRSVDVVLLRHVLEHLSDFRPALREALRIAARQVVMIFFLPPAEQERRLEHEGTNWNTYRLEDIREELRGHGVPVIDTIPNLDRNLAVVAHL